MITFMAALIPILFVKTYSEHVSFVKEYKNMARVACARRICNNHPDAMVGQPAAKASLKLFGNGKTKNKTEQAMHS
jgi:hypothetical protein